jgi:hypothetical protein
MISDLTDAMACAERALALAKDLDTVRGPGDLRQVSAGVRHELDCVIQSLSNALDGLAEAAVGDRPGCGPSPISGMRWSRGSTASRRRPRQNRHPPCFERGRDSGL